MRIVALLLVVALAGCLSGQDPDVKINQTAEQIGEESLAVLLQNHEGTNHLNASAHAATLNLERIGYHNGVDQSGDPNKIPGDTYYTELAVTQDRVYLARASVADPTQTLLVPFCGELPGNDPSRGGFSIIDVRDPRNPYHLGTYNALGGGDIEVSHDEKYVFFSTQRNCLTEIAGNLQENQDPSDVLPRGIHVVDVSDPSNPVLAFYLPMPINGPHTLSYFERGGTEYLVASTYDLYEEPGGGGLRTIPITQRVLIYEIMRAPAPLPESVGLRLANTFFLTDSASNGKMFFPHDAIVQQHPNTGQWLMYVAYWDKGVQIVDLTTMDQPLSALDQHTDFSPSAHDAIHQVRPFKEPINGMHVTVAEPEIITAPDETGYITFLNTTNPADIQKLGTWTLPAVDLGVQYLEFSPHNFDTWQDKVVLAHNHAGLWVIDASDPTEPRSVAYTLDVEPRANSPRMQPYFWGAFVVDDVIYASDESSGLYIYEYTGP